MAEDQSSIFSKLLNKDKEIEDLRVQIKALQDEKVSLEYMLIKSSEQIRKLQDDSETQASNRSESYKEQEKLTAEIEFLKKEIQMTRMNCQSYEKTNNLLGVEIQNMTQYIMKLSGTVNNAYNIISHYQNVEKEKGELEEKFKKQKKDNKQMKKEQANLRQKLIEIDSNLNSKGNESFNISKSIDDLIQKIEQQKKDYNQLQRHFEEKEQDIQKLKLQNEEQQKNISAQNKQISYLKIEKLSLKNKLEHSKNEILHLNSFQQSQNDQQSTLKRAIGNSHQRTKSLDNSFTHYNTQQKYQTEGGDTDYENLQKTICGCNKNYSSLRSNNNKSSIRGNSCSPPPPPPSDQYNKNNYVSINKIREFYQHQQPLQINNQTLSTDNLMQNKHLQNSPFNAYINNIPVKDQTYYNNHKTLNTSCSANSVLTGNDLSCCQLKQKSQSQIQFNSINDYSTFQSQNQQNNYSKNDVLSFQNNPNSNHTSFNQSMMNYQKNEQFNKQSMVKQILLTVEELILKEKVEKIQLGNYNETIIEQEVSNEDKILLDSIDLIIQNIMQVQIWECFSVILLVQKFKSLIQIILQNLTKAIKQNNQLQNIIYQSNQAIPLASEKEILQGVTQIIEQVGGDLDDDLTEEQKSRKILLSMNTNHISIIKEMEEPHQTKVTDETLLIDKLGKDIEQQDQVIKIIEQDDIKHLLTELQELNQSMDYNQYSQFFINRNRNNSSQSRQKLSIKQNDQIPVKLPKNQQLKCSDKKVEKITVEKCEKMIQTEQICYTSQEKKDPNNDINQANKETNNYIEKLKRQMQSQFSKKVKDLEQVLIVIKSVLNDEKENELHNSLNMQSKQVNAEISEKLQKVYQTNPNLKQFLQSFIEKIDQLKTTNQQLQLEVKKYQLSNKHIKQLR